jgi:hypothetical protein
VNHVAFLPQVWPRPSDKSRETVVTGPFRRGPRHRQPLYHADQRLRVLDGTAGTLTWQVGAGAALGIGAKYEYRRKTRRRCVPSPESR